MGHAVGPYIVTSEDRIVAAPPAPARRGGLPTAALGSPARLSVVLCMDIALTRGESSMSKPFHLGTPGAVTRP